MGCGVACLVMLMTVARRVPRVSRASDLLLGVEASEQWADWWEAHELGVQAVVVD